VEDLVGAVVICSSFPRHRLLSPPPSAPVAAVASLSSLHDQKRDQKHEGRLVGENTRGRELMGREV
jgi:hypothetical protein